MNTRESVTRLTHQALPYIQVMSCLSQHLSIPAGMHSSITSHIVNEYLLDEAAGVWGPNLPAFQDRLGNEAVKERIENLYFAYLFVLRAVVKASPFLESVQYTTGMPAEDARTLQLMQQLVSRLSCSAWRLARLFVFLSACESSYSIVNAFKLCGKSLVPRVAMLFVCWVASLFGCCRSRTTL